MKIKKITASILVVIVLFATLLAGCNVNTVIFNVCGEPVKAWAKSYDRSSPDTLTVYIEHDGATEEPQVITSAKTTNECSMRLLPCGSAERPNEVRLILMSRRTR